MYWKDNTISIVANRETVFCFNVQLYTQCCSYNTDDRSVIYEKVRITQVCGSLIQNRMHTICTTSLELCRPILLHSGVFGGRTIFDTWTDSMACPD